MTDAVERIWYGRDAGARAARLLLWPLGRVFAAVSTARGAMYDRGLLASHATALPAVSIGNLTVGGTGKTPVAAEVARRLAALGARPAIVLRGYGDDEPLVHERLNPGVPVVVAPDRVAGVLEARVRGATVAVLDDAFQHRRARRAVDVVLVSADRWRSAPPRPLPTGPWRESLVAMRRASIAVVTRKAASDGDVDDAVAAIRRAAPAVPVAIARLDPGELHAAAPTVDGGRRSLGSVGGRRVLLVSAIGDPAALVRQLERAGALVEPATFPDHHAFDASDVARLVQRASTVDVVICTLKDAVKLEARWPRPGPPLWYVSQSVTFERGEDDLDRVLRGLLPHRPPNP
ncbi:MAG TPA: tetraacyldisaccharide 4'-kinase [Gemmatimonadales bacterium]